MARTEAAAAGLPSGAIEALVRGDHGDPFAALGMHPAGRKGVVVRVFRPDAGRAWVLRADGSTLGEMSRLHPEGFFVADFPKEGPFPYRLRFESGPHQWEADDPYRFPPILGEIDVHLLAEGSHLELYRKLGAHPMRLDGVDGVAFLVWAPSASRVSVVGNFNGWDGRRHVMRKRVECGVFEIFVPGIGRGEPYKYEIKGPNGEHLPLKADPVAFRAEHPPKTASVVHGLQEMAWRDEGWMAERERANAVDAPISIYEVHLGSWMRVPEDGNRYLTYDELGDRLIPYVKELGFTHLECLPVSEFPFDGSWGYQPISLYAPTSRHGDPEAFGRFVDRCHQAGIGLILDWVPGHFPTDPHGLGLFDGTHLYEHADPRQGFQQDWNTLIYNYGRREVLNFLLANALFWLRHWHIDGLRVDAVASMLYLDYSRSADQWVPNVHGGRENLEAIAFLKRLNELAFGEAPGSTTMAEESTSWPSVSRPTYLGGLGFGFKWNMGWMHDTLDYMSREAVFRKYHHGQLTFGLVYAFSENFVLPISHDEVVHGKGSLINKMPGDLWQKFANLRAYYGFMFGHPGKKLLFMGCEIAQFREWNHDSSLDWHLTGEPMHQGMQFLIRDLNRTYRELGALHEKDAEPDGFEWLELHDADQSVLAFVRKGRDPAKIAVVVANFTPVPRTGYRVGVPLPGFYRERINSDAAIYGGSNHGNAGGVWSQELSSHGRPFSLELTLPPLATLILERNAN
ncbi:MAG TPA: 1,4-alpha-glucan branching protein GlgB [Geminicoccaceae bacterium]